VTWGYFFAAVGFVFLILPALILASLIAWEAFTRALVRASQPEPSQVIRLDQWERHAANVRRIDTVKRVQG
jgi:hypothetical protein